MEAGEKHEETALREVREETGVTGDLLEPIRKIGYSFYEPKTRQHISKTVHFFLIEYKNGSFDDHDDEVECASWFPLEEALRRAVYEGERDVLKQAETQLKRLK
jgi:8-oxo-dGTP pyrophosphatase MutT (NUDIX family)